MEKLKRGVPTTDYRCISATKFGVLNYIIFLSRIKSEEKKPRLVQLKKNPNYFMPESRRNKGHEEILTGMPLPYT